MAKVPVAGTVKTRLQPFLAPEECATLTTAFLQDAQDKAKTVCEKTILAYSPVAQRNILESILPPGNIFVEQTGTNLGEKMSNAFEFAFAPGLDAVVMIGTDSPTLPADFIKRAFEFLESDADIVLGKAEDGGFYLIGLRKNRAGLFKNIAWSSSLVFEQTAGNAERLGFCLRELPVWRDVDTPDDFLFLRNEMLADKTARQSAPATFRWFNRNARFFAPK